MNKILICTGIGGPLEIIQRTTSGPRIGAELGNHSHSILTGNLWTSKVRRKYWRIHGDHKYKVK
jgi:hypothetical protein